MGGDRPIENDTHHAIVENMARGLRHGDGGRHLITFHPCGGHSSSEYVHHADWLDFNMWQTGHERDRDNYNSIAGDYALSPAKPCMDAEPGYDDHPSAFDVKNGYLCDRDVRRSLYWALFAGAHGHTYGCHDIWQFWDGSREGKNFPHTPWRKALQLPGAGQMQYARKLLESRPILSRIPDQTMIAETNPNGGQHVQATRDENGSYAFIYFPAANPALIDLTKLTGEKIRASWFDPRNGKISSFDILPGGKTYLFTPPATDEAEDDWILILDALTE